MLVLMEVVSVVSKIDPPLIYIRRNDGYMKHFLCCATLVTGHNSNCLYRRITIKFIISLHSHRNGTLHIIVAKYISIQPVI